MPPSVRSLLLTSLGVGVLAGGFMATQSRVNGELSARIHDAPLTSLISFGSGTVILLLITLVSKRTRTGFSLVVRAIRERKLAWFYTLAGVSGSMFVFAQALVVGITGVAMFTIAFVCGLILGSYGLDVWGIGPAGRQPVTLWRTVGSVLAIIAVFVTMIGRFGEPSGLSLIVLPLLFGAMVAWQQVANGVIAVAAKTPLTSTTINFLVGTGLLAIMAGIYSLIDGLPQTLPTDPWVYLGGLCGVFFVPMTAWVVRYIGALLTSLATTVGQLITAVMFDLVMPQTQVDLLTTALGTLAMVAAMAVVVVARLRRSGEGLVRRS